MGYREPGTVLYKRIFEFAYKEDIASITYITKTQSDYLR